MAQAVLTHRAARVGRLHVFTFIAAALEARRQRRALANLDAHMRRDLGLDPDDIRREADRPIWDVPQSWLR
jgi:uncharacterized protein YjiS (DUF1127 family)